MQDFNSLPWKVKSDDYDTVPPGEKLVSGVYEILTQGSVPPAHPDHPSQRAKRGADAATLRQVELSTSGLQLQSGNVASWGAEPSFTNRTPGFSGCLDYVFTSPHFEVVSALEMPYAWNTEAPEAALEEVDSLFPVIPNEAWPSDHLAVGCKLRWI